jgi:hypothetical protein
MKISIPTICNILLGGIIAIGSTASFVIDLTSTQNIVGIGIDLLVMFVSYMTVWNAIYSHIEERISRKKMEQEWDYKVKPLTNLLLETIGKVNRVEDEIMNTNRKMNSTMEYVMRAQDMDASKVYILPGASFKFICKVMVLIIFTFSALIYTTAYPLGIVHYFILVIYLCWWTLFTSEYKLFHNTTAWVWGIAPIMIIPTVGIILDTTLGLNYMIGILFFGLFIYTYSYYTWTCFETTGFRLIDIEGTIRYLRKKYKNVKYPSKEEFHGLIFKDRNIK